ncbi:MAG: type II secretion system protein M [Burkholderiales bacterium]|nr:type II secretion system protein M [Burkholderiales bacterium]
MLAAARMRWAQASRRERWLVTLAAIVVAGALGFVWLWQPMLADKARLARDLPRERAMLAAARAQAADLAALGRLPAPPRTALVPAIERALAEHGIRAAAGGLDETGGRVRLELAAVRFDALLRFLAALTRAGDVRVVEATLTQRVAPGEVRAELVLAH